MYRFFLIALFFLVSCGASREKQTNVRAQSQVLKLIPYGELRLREEIGGLRFHISLAGLAPGKYWLKLYEEANCEDPGKGELLDQDRLVDFGSISINQAQVDTSLFLKAYRLDDLSGHSLVLHREFLGTRRPRDYQLEALSCVVIP